MKVKLYLAKCVSLIPFLLLVGICAATMNVYSSTGRTLTLEECLSIAMEHNSDAITAQKDVESAAQEVRGAWANFLPHLDASSSYSHTVTSFYSPEDEQFFNSKYDSYSANLSFSQYIYRGGYNFANLSYARAGHRNARHSFEETKQALVLEVKGRYYELLKASRMLTVRQEEVHSSEEQVKREENLYKIGTTTKANVLRTKVKLGEDRLNLIAARNDLSLAKANLNYILGWDQSDPIEVEDNLAVNRPTLDVEALIEEAVSQHLTVRMAEAQVQQARATVGMAKSGRMPSLSASGGYSWTDTDLPEGWDDWKGHDSWDVRLSLSMPLFDGFSTKSNIRQAQVNVAIAEEDLEEAKRDVSLAVKQAFLNVAEADESIQVTEESVALAKEEMRLAEERYRLGASTMLELIDAQVILSTAQTNHIRALYEYNLAIAQLEKAVGKPLIRQ